MTVFQQAIFLLLFIVVSYFGVIRPGLSLAPWVPTFKKDLKRVHKICNLQSGQTFFEAGCGNARVLLYMAKKHPDVLFVGVEFSFLMFVWARMQVLFSGLKNIEVRYGDALRSDIVDVDVVYAYGLTETVNEKLLPKMKMELKPGARFISYSFEILGEGVQAFPEENGSTIYVYTQPKKYCS